MKRPRQLLQLTGTGFFLFAMVLALRLTTPPEAGPSSRTSDDLSKTAVSKAGFDPATAANPHDGSAAARSASFETLASHASGGTAHGAILEYGRQEGVPISNEDRPISFRDPLIARFPELESMKLRMIDPHLAGHSLPAFGRRAAVEEASQVSGTTGVMLTLSVDPITPTPEENPPASESRKIENPEAPPGAHTAASWKGFTYEQELFRTKWGWQAFDQVQKVLREQQGP